MSEYQREQGRRSPPPVTGLRTKKLIAFGWYGGKFSHLDWLLPLLPECHHYCEPFAGSAAVLLNRPPSPIETYNDLDGEACNFFRVLREQKDTLTEAIALTLFSREEFAVACLLDPTQSPLERASAVLRAGATGANGVSRRRQPLADGPTARIQAGPE